jgi:hypothetical protein
MVAAAALLLLLLSGNCTPNQLTMMHSQTLYW